MNAPDRVLVIRRDNIGDLVCTTPLFHTLKRTFPAMHLAVYVNSYNAPVLLDHPDINAVHVYTKAKHRAPGEGAFGAYLRRIRQLIGLRRQRFDDVILAESAYSPRLVRLAQFLARRRVIGFASDAGHAKGLDYAVPQDHAAPLAAVIHRLAAAYGITSEAPPLRVVARPLVPFPAPAGTGPLIGLHISARKPSQRWPAENFSRLAHLLHQRYGSRFVLFWSPGDETNRLHPGDDQKAQRIVEATAGLPLITFPTVELRQLIDGLACCDNVICADGGAMHLAAGLGKPLVCLFGQSDARCWRPWGVPYELLQKTSRQVTAIAVEEVVEAYAKLLQHSTIANRSSSGCSTMIEPVHYSAGNF